MMSEIYLRSEIEETHFAVTGKFASIPLTPPRPVLIAPCFIPIYPTLTLS